MPVHIIVLMLLMATLSASWNAMIKGAGNKLYMTILMTGGASLVGLLVLPFVPAPARPSWPFILASGALSVVYYATVAKTYHLADLSQTFPVMRGGAPMLVAMTSWAVVGEHLTTGAWLGVALICAGILGLATTSAGRSTRGLALALANAGVIATYTLVDGLGVRRSGSPVAYCLWVNVLTGLPLTAWALVREREGFWSYVSGRLGLGVLGGAMNTAIYSTTLWAMTLAPVAVVAALRETSILFTLLISSLVLKERVGGRRLALACAIAGGVMALRLA
jgi:drug/metabolite transporter (DMT)-like permease